MSTDHLEDQALARLKQLRSQRQRAKNTTQGNLTHPEIYQTQPLSTALTSQGISLVGNEDIWQRSTLPVKKIAETPASALASQGVSLASSDDISQRLTLPTKIAETPASAFAMQGFFPASNEDICQRSTFPIKIVETPVPAELSPIERIPITPEQMLITMPPVQTMPVTPQMQHDGIAAILFTWFYRIWLICATFLLMFLLFWLQAQLDRVHIHPTTLRTIVQWTELTWLIPIPLAIVLWVGWFFFAEAARSDPLHVSAPVIVLPKQGIFSFVPPKPARLIFRFVTRGDNVDILRDSVIAVHQAFDRYQQFSGPYEIEIISEHPISLNLGSNSRTRIYVVPPTYGTPHLSRFKARALTYLQKQVHPRQEDWYIYLDEESLVNEHMVAGVYRFIWRSTVAEQRAQKEGKKSLPSRLIGQGAILYQGGNWFFRGADALRTADDLGRFRLQYALGVPMFGIHGSYIVIRGIHDKQLSFDVGPANSITEDAAWALRAWSKGFRFAWVQGYLHEQPPQKARDFVRQRSRWLSGIRSVLRDRQTPFLYRLCLGMFTILWQLAFLPFLVAVVALFIHASPFYWIRLPADFAWATFTLAYLQGIDIQSRYPHPFLKKDAFELQWKRAVSWLLILCSIWYALLEAVGVLYSFKPRQGFFVIHKPSLAAENKKVKRQRPQ